MKTNIIMKLAKLCLLFLLPVSCVDLQEDPPSELSPTNYYSSQDELDSALTGIARSLYSGWSGFDYGIDLILGSGAEDISSNAGVYINFDYLIPNDGEYPVRDFWTKAYQTISNANAFIANMGNAKDVRKEVCDEMEGQARFFRALAYFYLVRFFGPIQVTTYENQFDIAHIKQSTVEQVYTNAIIPDLLVAEEKLPVSFSEKGRPTSGAAKALLAKVYLTMAGWPVDKPQEYYPLAMEKASGIIDGSEYEYALEEDFADLWTQKNKLTSREFIFQVR